MELGRPVRRLWSYSRLEMRMALARVVSMIIVRNRFRIYSEVGLTGFADGLNKDIFKVLC